MSSQKAKSSRQVALEVLDTFDKNKHDSRKTLHQIIEQTSRKAHATDLVFGTIRNRPAIDMLITQFSGLQLKRIKPRLINILRIGAYEMVYVSQTPSHAVVNEAVNLAHLVAGKKEANFVNAILRKMSRMINHRNASLKRAIPARCIPVDSRIGCEFIDEILPDPEKDPAGYLSKAFSIGKWLISEWLKEFGFDKTMQICFASNRRPGVYLQPNTLHLSETEFADKLTSSQIEFDIVAKGKMLKLKTHKAISSLPGYREGFFTVQDPTAAHVANVLSPKPGWTVLDLCAAPGGKTVRLAQVMAGRGTIIATDIDSQRLTMVDQNCERLGITMVKTVAYDDLPRLIEQTPKFDAILLDVPCSNTGVMARRPEVRLRIRPQTVKSLAKIQSQLLRNAADIARKGTKICYSTCSIQKGENADLVKAFLHNNTDFKLLAEKLTLPFLAHDESFDYDGGYVAILQKQC
jgi:16S rRNA (cytosine967-C5)-methyltransferase